MKKKIIAFILAYKCERLIARAYERIPRHLVDDIIVTDNDSPDKTVEVARALGLRVFTHAPGNGYGGNLKEGLRICFSEGADYAVEVHGDGAQFDPISIQYALPLMDQEYDLILGSRFRQPGKALANGMPLIRFLANRFLSFFDRLVLQLPLTEFHTGFRIYSRHFYETIPLEGCSDDYLLSFQVIAQSAYFNLKVGEVDVEADYKNDHTSQRLSGAFIYAFQTFGVLRQYLLARAGWSHSPCFPKK